MPLDPSQLQALLNSYTDKQRPDLDEFNRSSAHGLGQDASEGLEAAQYLLGHKKKQVETFFDKHPVQAVGQDLANSAPTIGAGLIAGHAGHSFLKDYLLNRKINKIQKGVVGKDEKGPRSYQGLEGRPDREAIFGNKIKTEHIPYAEAYEKLHAVKPNLQGLSDDEAVRLLHKHLSGNAINNQVDEEVMPKMVQQLFSRHPEAAGELAGKVKERFANPNVEFAGKDVNAFGKEFKLPSFKTPISKDIASHFHKGVGKAGLGLAAGGMALSPIISFLQRKVYGDPQVKEWKKNQDMVEGKF